MVKSFIGDGQGAFALTKEDWIKEFGDRYGSMLHARMDKERKDSEKRAATDADTIWLYVNYISWRSQSLSRSPPPPMEPYSASGSYLAPPKSTATTKSSQIFSKLSPDPKVPKSGGGRTRNIWFPIEYVRAWRHSSVLMRRLQML